MSLAPGTRIGPYEVSSMIGEGGMGEVYRARDTRLGRTVAIKFTRSDTTEVTQAHALLCLSSGEEPPDALHRVLENAIRTQRWGGRLAGR